MINNDIIRIGMKVIVHREIYGTVVSCKKRPTKEDKALTRLGVKTVWDGVWTVTLDTGKEWTESFDVRENDVRSDEDLHCGDGYSISLTDLP